MEIATERIETRRARNGPWNEWWSKAFWRSPFYGISLVTLAVLLGLWEGVVRLFRIKIIILPAPSLVAEAIVDYAVHGTMWADLLTTGRRALIGLALGMVLGVGLGLLIGWYPRFRAAANPVVSVTFPIPKIALVPLFIIWFGIGDSFKIVLIVVSVFYVSLVNTIAGVEAIPPVTFMASRNLGGSNRQILQKVVLPASIPVIFAALRISYSGALILVIAAEMIVSTDGLGHMIVTAGQLLQTERVFAGLLVSGFLGLVGYWIIDLAEIWLLPWRDVSASRKGAAGEAL